MKKQTTCKLELVWPGKEDWERPEPRLLLEKERYGAKKGSEDNLLIYGDNLLGLKALERDYSDKVKCIYIDPPYNSKSAFQNYENPKDKKNHDYNDNLEHSKWLNLMKERLCILHRLLRNDGTIWISIDDDECHYLKVLCDEIFGRKNFIANLIWEKKHTRANDAKYFSDNHDHVLCYAKNIERATINLLPRTDEANANYTNIDNDPRGPWASGPCHAKRRTPRDIYPITTPSGRKVYPPPGTSWRFSRETFSNLIKDNCIYFGPKGSNIPRYKRFFSEVQDGLVSKTLWLRSEVGDNQEAKQEVKSFNSLNVFPTPKPERLIKRILELATESGDLVLDSFAGSGTTGAVAHKMRRRWIMIEMNGPCKTHIIPRLQKVIDGADQGGITEAVNWKGGGGFRYCDLAPSLLEKNRLNRWVISKKYNPIMLIKALCNHDGYTFNPRQEPWWLHGHCTENDFIHVTASTLDRQQLARLSQALGDGQSLLVYCGAFRANPKEFENLTLKKIPKSILDRCTWGRDDYSLRAALQDEADAANKRKPQRASSTPNEIVRVSIAAQGGRS